MIPLRATSSAPMHQPTFLRGAWRLLAVPLLLFTALPVVAVLLRLSWADVSTSLQNPQVLSAIRLSLVTSVITVIITLALGTPTAYLLLHLKAPMSHLVDTLIDLPTVLPPAVAGVALLITFGRRGLVGAWLEPLGISIPFTTAAVVIAQTFIAAPLYVKAASLGFATVDEELKNAAALDGAGRGQVFWHIVLPMAWPSIVGGCALTWARALGEFGATIIFAGNFSGRTQTMPLAIYLGFEINIAAALTLSAILMMISFIVLVTVKTLLQRGK